MAAKKAITDTALPYKDSIRAIRTAFKLKWKHERDSCTKKLHLTKPVHGEWKSCNHQEQFIAVIVCHLLVGRTHPTHYFFFCLQKTHQATRDQEPLTLMHILLTCTHLETHRQKLLHNLYNIHVNLRPALGLEDDTLVRLPEPHKFLDDTGYLHKL